jgi:tetratricopeptide (TPR) repeat protein
MTDAPSPPSEYPLHSLEYFWQRITFGTVTEDDAAAMWTFIVSAAHAAHANSVDDAKAPTTRDDFKSAVLDINARGDAGERVALALLVQGATDEAATRCEAIVGKAGDDPSDKLWCKGALFAPVAPSIARDAWQRLLQLRPDFHYARCVLGMVLKRLGDLRGAEAAYQSVVINASDDKKMQAWAVDKLGHMALRRRDLESAAHFFERSLQLNRELQDSAAVYLKLMRLAGIAESRENLVLAESYLQQALTVAGERTDAAGVLNALGAVSIMAEQRGDLAAAEDAARRAIDLHEHLGNQLGTADRYARLGELALQRDDLTGAFKHLDHARAISQKIGDDAGTARAFGSLGVIRAREQEYGDADWYFKNAAALYEKVGDLGMNALMLEKFGWTSYVRENAVMATEQLQQALVLYTRAGMHEEAQKLRQDMGKVGLG